MRKVMKLKKNIAILMAFLMVFVTLHFNEMCVKAATVYVEEDTSITTNSGDSYVVSPNPTNAEVTLTVNSVVSGDITLGGGYPGKPSLINNGTINGTVYANDSTMRDVTINNYGYIENLIAENVYSITGEGTYGTINVNNPSGSISLTGITVNDSITLDDTTASYTNSIYVDVYTNVNLPSNVYLLSDVQANDSITTNGEGYYVYEFTSGSIASNYGCKVTVNPGDGWELVLDSASGNKYWYEEAVPTVTYRRLPGYSAPTGTNYGVTKTSGNGTISTSLVDNVLSLDYTLAAQGTEVSEIVIDLPDLTELAPGTVDVTMAESFYVNDEIKPTVSTSDYEGDPTIEYAVRGSDTYSTAAPTTAGNYTVKVSYDANYNFAAYSETADFIVNDLEEGVATFNIPNIYVGQNIVPEYSSTTNNAVIDQAEITYSIKGEDDFTINVPEAIGEYTAKLYIPATGHYNEITTTCDFSILEKMDGLAEITVADVSFGEDLNPQYSSTTNEEMTPTVYYKLQSEGEEAYNTDAPTAVGEYNAKVVYPETEEYKEAIDETTFSILYLQGEGQVSVEDVYVGTPIEPQYSTTTNLGVEPKVEYKLIIDDEDAYNETEPTAVGAYNIRVTYPATESHDVLELVGTFDIMALETGDGTLDIQDVYVGTSILPVVNSTKNGIENVTVEYRLQGETEYTTTIPTAVGMYEARAIFAATYMYDVFIADDTFEIKALEQGVGEISVEDVYVGTDISVSYNSETNTDNPVIEYKKAEEEDSAYQTTVPSQVGDYVVRATFPATPVYDKLVVTDEFAIKALEIGEGSVMVEDVYHGQTYMPIVASSTNGTDNVLIEYKLKDEADLEYTIEKPQDIGDYVVRATFPATPVYDKLVVTDEFAIKDYETGSCSVKIDDVYYGQSYEPVVESSTNGTSDVVIEYKLKGQDDSEYTTSKPQDIGNYVVRVTFASVSYYKEAVATDEFAIKDFEDGVGTLEVLDVICGVNVNPIIGSNTNGVENATIYYKAAGADDSKYTTVKPTAVGEYVAKAVFKAVGIYKEVTVTDAFTISYLAMPENPYAIEGTQGENEYYTSEIVVKAKDGYLISDIFGKDYKEQLTINSSTESKYIYLMNKETGEQTAGMLLESLYVDLVAPSVGAVNNTVYYGDKLEIALTDDNLTRVVVNGKEIAANELITQNNILTLESEGGVTEYTIKVWDVAGNMTTTTISVASEWTKQGVIPAGVAVKLQANTPYSFGEGEWNVEGDNTSYSGNITFYVEEEEKLTFNQK